jgi:hypothetical protein
MKIAIDLAWNLVDELVKEYKSREAAEDELGDLDMLALTFADVIDANGLQDETDLVYLQSIVDDLIG